MQFTLNSTSLAFNCPFGDLQLKNGKPVQCTSTQDLPTETSTVTQTCESNFYCALDPNWGLTKGFCCPVPPTVCPRGTAKLMQNGPFDCPRASHYYSYDSFRGMAVCCPKPCKLEDIFVSGKCLPALKLGETCARNEQCTEHLTKCKNMLDSKGKKGRFVNYKLAILYQVCETNSFFSQKMCLLEQHGGIRWAL